MVSHPENGSDSPIGSDRDRGRDSHKFVYIQIWSTSFWCRCRGLGSSPLVAVS